MTDGGSSNYRKNIHAKTVINQGWLDQDLDVKIREEQLKIFLLDMSVKEIGVPRNVLPMQCGKQLDQNFMVSVMLVSLLIVLVCILEQQDTTPSIFQDAYSVLNQEYFIKTIIKCTTTKVNECIVSVQVNGTFSNYLNSNITKCMICQKNLSSYKKKMNTM